MADHRTEEEKESIRKSMVKSIRKFKEFGGRKKGKAFKKEAARRHKINKDSANRPGEPRKKRSLLDQFGDRSGGF